MKIIAAKEAINDLSNILVCTPPERKYEIANDIIKFVEQMQEKYDSTIIDFPKNEKPKTFSPTTKIEPNKGKIVSINHITEKQREEKRQYILKNFKYPES